MSSTRSATRQSRVQSSFASVGALRDEMAVIYGLPGSEHVTKIVMAFAAKGLPFVLQKVHTTRSERARYMPRKTAESDAAYPYFPVVRFANGDVVVNSMDICLYLDKTYPDRPLLFPPDQIERVKELDTQISEGLLYQGAIYLNVESKEVFEKFAEKKMLPALLPNGCFRFLYKLPGCHSIILNESYKQFYSNESAHKKWTTELDQETAKEWLKLKYAGVTEEILKEYRKFDDYLAESSTPFFCDSETPTAADLMLYSLATRIGGTNLGLCDPQLGPYYDVFYDCPALLEQIKAIEKEDWVLNDEGTRDGGLIPYKWADIRTFSARRIKPLGVPVNPERCP